MATGSAEFVLRPFEGLPGEPDWVALKEVVPAATATARTVAEHGGRDVLVTTSLPEGSAALHRADGVVLLALAPLGGSGDASRDGAAALLTALAAEPGTAVPLGPLPGPGPRLQDVLDPDVPFVVTVHDGFEWWAAPGSEATAELREEIEEADAAVAPTRRLASVPFAYWSRLGGREFVRWAQPADEQQVLDGLARLHAVRESGFAGGRFVGYFRSSGLVIVVWELARGTEAEQAEAALAQFAPRFLAAVGETAALDPAARRARSGLVARQVTLR